MSPVCKTAPEEPCSWMSNYGPTPLTKPRTAERAPLAWTLVRLRHFSSPACSNEGCWLTGGGAKFSTITDSGGSHARPVIAALTAADGSLISGWHPSLTGCANNRRCAISR